MIRMIRSWWPIPWGVIAWLLGIVVGGLFALAATMGLWG